MISIVSVVLVDWWYSVLFFSCLRVLRQAAVNIHSQCEGGLSHFLASTDWGAHWLFLGQLDPLVDGEHPFNSLVLTREDLQCVCHTKNKVALTERRQGEQWFTPVSF